jgi:hypothetical protein
MMGHTSNVLHTAPTAALECPPACRSIFRSRLGLLWSAVAITCVMPASWIIRIASMEYIRLLHPRHFDCQRNEFKSLAFKFYDDGYQLFNDPVRVPDDPSVIRSRPSSPSLAPCSLFSFRQSVR